MVFSEYETPNVFKLANAVIHLKSIFGIRSESLRKLENEFFAKSNIQLEITTQITK
jgi:hypothetical protein